MSNADHKADLILASASPRRVELIQRTLGLACRVLPAGVEEAEEEAFVGDPQGLVNHNARLKAEWVASRHPQAWVLAADTTVALDGRIFNKPVDMAEAKAMLRTLSGRTHTVYTAVVIKRHASGHDASTVVASGVRFKPLDDATIDAYFDRVNPLDKAGAYGIQEASEMIIAGHTGSWTNIMGLPVEWVEEALRKRGLWEPLVARSPISGG